MKRNSRPTENDDILEFMKRLDLTANLFSHPFAKLMWIASTIGVTFLWVMVLGKPLSTTSAADAFKIVGLGLVAAVVYPPSLQWWLKLRRDEGPFIGHVIAHAPGGRVIPVLRFLFTKRAFDHIFAQVVVDGREEYWEALSQGNKWLARWRRVQLYLSLGIAIVSWIGVSALKNAIKMWKAG
ncbi:MAG: hypothetical protein EOR67_28610 [Mesorhizobium sp.]|uniref:hypothetical protein n=1 Tax=Mesorhizobium sp. TaxID=1871066 RepID=UPI000FE8837D|nr:hypothetical protein [Mesorhizobium sp.]RWL81897.1 MAG: hypothetical protein EOR67_28610 [Mesorhizobium sp.]RWL82287.1 MAG: hypothetical protein EOR69_16385 [Mesorhizobium sp.]RWL98648.1 MAG: hypothetical protein EOR70_12580 [Mesorhizobium sp.]